MLRSYLRASPSGAQAHRIHICYCIDCMYCTVFTVYILTWYELRLINDLARKRTVCTHSVYCIYTVYIYCTVYCTVHRHEWCTVYKVEMMRSYFRTSSSGAQAHRVYTVYTVYCIYTVLYILCILYSKWISWRRWREYRPGRMTYCIYCTVHVKPWSASCNESWLPVDPRKVRSLLIEMTRTHPFVFS